MVVAPAEVREVKKEVAIERYLSRLAYCESRGNPKAINPDDMGSPSFGLFQYKIGTFKYFSDMFNFEGDIMNGEDQWELTKMVISADEGNKSHWFNCNKSISLK